MNEPYVTERQTKRPRLDLLLLVGLAAWVVLRSKSSPRSTRQVSREQFKARAHLEAIRCHPGSRTSPTRIDGVHPVQGDAGPVRGR